MTQSGHPARTSAAHRTIAPRCQRPRTTRHADDADVSSTSFRSPFTIHRPDPGDDLPKVVIGLDNLAEGRHRPDYGLGALAFVAQLPERIAGTKLTCAKRDEPEQRVVVIAIDPNLIGKGRRHAAAAPTSMAAIAACSHVLAMAFLGDAGEVCVGAFQLTFRRAGHAFHRGHGLLGRYNTASGQSG